MIGETRPAGIDPFNLQKGTYIDIDRVQHQWRKNDSKAEERIQRYENGDLSSNPESFAAQNTVNWIERQRKDGGAEPIVMRTDHGGIRVLTDAEAVRYLNNQANAGLRKHKSKTEMLLTAVDASQLTDHQQRELETHQRKHAFILAAHQGARTQGLRMQRKGMVLPDYRDRDNKSGQSKT